MDLQIEEREIKNDLQNQTDIQGYHFPSNIIRITVICKKMNLIGTRQDFFSFHCFGLKY